MSKEVTIELTGNPFVDTGIAVASSLARLPDVRQCTLATLKSVYHDGTQLTEWNSALKAFTQVFGTNNPLFQPSYGYKKGRGPSGTNKKIYKSILRELLSEIEKLGHGPRCWACGTPSNFDFGEVCRRAIEASGEEAPDSKWVGRDWFPLAGSLGSDAQALPAASRPVHICPRCLLTVHYLPLGLMLIDGKLAVFQSTSVEFWYGLVRSIVNEVKGRIHSGNYATLGSREGARAVLERLLNLFGQLQREERYGRVTKRTPLYVWRFSNSGNSPECAVFEIPDPAITFLWDAKSEGADYEIKILVSSESKNPRYSMFQCILNRRDYSNLYPRGKRAGASMKLYALYQTRIRDHTTSALRMAHKLAQEASRSIGAKEFKRMQRREAFAEARVRNRFRAIMVQMALNGDLNLNDYLDLFGIRRGPGITVEWDGWELIRFYLHHADEDFPKVTREHERTKDVHPLVLYYAAKIYNDYIDRRGKDQFEKEVLSHSQTMNVTWLRSIFLRLAESEDGLTYADWSELCKLENGDLFVTELIFEMRLLWAQWLKESKQSIVVEKRDFADASDGLSQRIGTLLEALFGHYVDRLGMERSRRDILQRLRRKEIGLKWFHDRLTKQISDEISPLTEDEWEEFLVDDQGRSVVFERLFQLHLAATNLLRKRETIQSGGVLQ